MRPQSFYFLTAIFMFFYMTFVPVIEAYSAIVDLDMTYSDYSNCRIWIEDSNHNRIAGDEKGDYHACDGSDGEFEEIDFPAQEYYVVAKVELSTRKQKVRGPFTGENCFEISGNVFSFSFDQINCQY
ncbi:unnamed protein product [Rhizophagus irregularis]|uniref:Uncharacterized protein n=5 Tax=Rhizophagus irregularis TaxID=588596 RepID=A0A915YTK6_9GLOM|nr:hypothetical protein GLOIN_2v1470246 [Rhizophagus irregularis DAOM 181602=DAOM 197198]CAB4480405.1 unnamed protein product [Rhizophagus irregularis]POG81956.1 hypothetical protein GLOIN_2v1470246 [Rhizophagus irregularis DAOM 181602=DAOM 197198]CAB5332819.1 unnamed protein product [Rhizophagus irregularis]CAG8447047.1 4521_t:CDS:2 [Rhizophagus irregularis]GBC24974.2 hypothetical protein GLOIN_2v1470246 [Rhizophagus irregularis DAOM 181602=DAOM 197198]|eukprot:XP_025188822.1 hypothetical protein GLOIN_2v1470246 [Rhizophagus irregularis DAOM 181602=DAOM 197198]